MDHLLAPRAMTSEATDVAVLVRGRERQHQALRNRRRRRGAQGHRPLPLVRADRVRGAGRPRREDHRRRDHGGLSGGRPGGGSGGRNAGSHLRSSRRSAARASRFASVFTSARRSPVEGDVFGDSVNVAARMAALAKGEQVILSAADRRRAVPALAFPRPGDRLPDRQGQAGGDRHLRD